ncbi:MAG: protein disulfide isomerase family protein [Candidatus Andeanibacterium colombiense]|uniref:Protein disulfide isomerase family protein n=1 Tax=Candidatus Andeanibacterium colombiense TaxID=3121345 RepID=A0AAJ6BLK2_9SPHN|nr:MAG: protein disulfide isomerase family protein [Sphingomonadaceae bacterium]
MTDAPLPSQYFAGLSAQQTGEIETLTAELAAERSVGLAAVAAARAKAEGGLEGLSEEERAAFQPFLTAYQRWSFAAITPAMVKLSDANFEELALDPERMMLVQFSTSWCGPCHRAAPVLNELAERGARVGKLDCEVAVDTARRFAIASYPTFVLYVKGKMKAIYRGPRTVEDFEAWLSEFE